MSYPAGARLPFEALHSFVGPIDALNHEGHQSDARMSHIERVVGVNRRTLQRWRHVGVPLKRADAVAVALGAHPVDIWPDWYEVSA